MLATVDHGVFDQAIIEGNFDPELIPFLRISELNDRAFHKVFGTIHDVAMRSEKQEELSDHIFKYLSNENVGELLQRSESNYGGLGRNNFWVTIIPHIRDHSVFNEAVDNLFGSAKTDEELSQNMNNMVLEQLRFAELNDQVIEKIRRAAFYKMAANRLLLPLKNIAVLIRRDGGLDAVAAPYKNRSNGEESSVFKVLFKEGRLTDEILEYILSERPAFLNDFDLKLMSRIPKDILKKVVFRDKSSELSEETFKPAG